MPFHRLARVLPALFPLVLTAGCSVGGNSSSDGGNPSVDAASTYVELGPVAGASVEVRTLAGAVIGQGETAAYDEGRDTELNGSERRLRNVDAGRLVGKVRYARLDFSGLADSDIVLLSATGGRDVDANDDGILTADEGTNGPAVIGKIAALVRVSDLRAGTVFMTPLTTIASAAVGDSVSAVAVAERLNRYATFMLKAIADGGDVNSDNVVDWRDLYRYDPSHHVFSESGSTRNQDAAIRTPELLALFLATSAGSQGVAHQIIIGGEDNTPTKLATRLFGDSDSDGLANVFEDPSTNDSDKDSVVDSRDTDMDGDGLANDIEAGLGLIPWNADTDQDGIKDGQEDFDDDGLDNATEVSKTTDPKKTDTDDDGLTDKQEIDNGLDPLKPADGATADSDTDGISNAAEIANGLKPNDATDGSQDLDSDGLTNKDEIVTNKTDPRKADTDGDGINDGSEVANGLNPLDAADGGTVDSDGDGLTNAAEIANGLNPKDPADADLDPDGDGLASRAEVTTYGTNPKVADTDGDGLRDGDEVKVYHTNPKMADTDGDGLNDGREVTTFGTDPLNPDSDGDSISDGSEANGFFLYDKVTKVVTDPTRADTDGDGIHDGIEKAVQDQFAAYASVGKAKDFLLGPLNPNNTSARPDLGGLSFTDISLKADSLEQDPDADRKPTIEELFHGTNPNNAASSFSYIYESNPGGPRKAKFSAMDASNFVYVPGAWDVDGDGVIEPGFFISRFEAKNTNTAVASAPTTGDLLASLLVYNASSMRFSDRLCNNDMGGTSSDADTTDTTGSCRGNQYKATLISQASTGLKRVTFTAAGNPVSGESWVEAAQTLRESPVDAAAQAGGPYPVQLPTDLQWVQIARTAALNPTNWTGGKVGEGQLFQGHSDNAPSGLLPITTTTDPYDGTGNSATVGAEQKRVLIIGNGVATRDFDLPLSYSVSVWDLAGNVAEWTAGVVSAAGATATTAGRAGGDRFAGGLAEFEDYAGLNLTGAAGDIATMPAWWKPSLANGTVLNTKAGTGAYFDGSPDSDIDGDGKSNGAFATVDYGYGNGYRESYSAITRGGYFASTSFAGIYFSSLDNGLSRRSSFIGFRAVASQ